MSFDYAKHGKLEPLTLDVSTKKVYICHPLGGDFEKNVQKVVAVCRVIGCWLANYLHGSEPIAPAEPPWASRTDIWEIIPIAPYLECIRYLDDKDRAHRALGLAWDLAIIDTCDEIWVIGKHVSYGMQLEISHAALQGKPIRWLDYADFGLDEDALNNPIR